MQPDHYIPGYLIDTTNKLGGLWVFAWQHVTFKPVMVDVNGVLTPNGQEYAEQAGFVSTKLMPDGSYEPIIASTVHEFHAMTSDQHFAPGELKDPKAPKPSGLTMDQVVAALNVALKSANLDTGTGV